jgi:hypothetical protein
MKLKLVQENNIQILMVSEGVTSKDVEIIKAGITKILKTGKNKILLEVNGSDTLPDDVIRDIGIMDNLARELSGRIVIVTSNAALKKKLDIFATPPLILCFVDRKSAMAAFSPQGPLDEGKKKHAPAPPLPAPPAPALSSASVSTPQPVSKDTILAREAGDLGVLRKDLAELKRENQILHDRLLALVENRRQSVDSTALTAKIRALELEVEKLLASPASPKP